MGLSWWEARITPKLTFQQISSFCRQASLKQLVKKEKKKNAYLNIEGAEISLTMVLKI